MLDSWLSQKVLSEHEALSIIGHNLEILFLLMGMMMIVEIMSETGIFQWVAIKIAQLVREILLKF